MAARYTARSWALLTSITVVVAAVLAFLITGSPDSDPAVASTTPSPSRPTPSSDGPAASEPKSDPKPKPTPKAKPEPDQKAGKDKARPKPSPQPSAYVEVYNNSGVTGLAGETAGELSAAGWQVVSIDNWYGDIPETTVYYPGRLKAQAALLADEVGATRTRPAVEPMRFDRLTLILTGDL